LFETPGTHGDSAIEGHGRPGVLDGSPTKKKPGRRGEEETDARTMMKKSQDVDGKIWRRTSCNSYREPFFSLSRSGEREESFCSLGSMSIGTGQWSLPAPAGEGAGSILCTFANTLRCATGARRLPAPAALLSGGGWQAGIFRVIHLDSGPKACVTAAPASGEVGELHFISARACASPVLEPYVRKIGPRQVNEA